MTDGTPGRFMFEDGRAGWFAFEPDGSRIKDGDEDPVIRIVRLSAHEHAGPFWDDEGHISDDYEELRRWIGITRPLFDDVMAWNDEVGGTTSTPQRDAGWSARHLAKQRELTDRMRAEVHPGIEVMDLS